MTDKQEVLDFVNAALAIYPVDTDHLFAKLSRAGIVFAAVEREAVEFLLNEAATTLAYAVLNMRISQEDESND